MDSVVKTRKAELLNSLGPKASEYWDHLKRFFRAKEARIALDQFILTNFNPDQVHLHNQFIEALLNAGHQQGDHLDKLSEQNLTLTNEGDELKNDPSRRELKKKDIMAIPKSDRQQIRALNQKRKQAKVTVEPLYVPKSEKLSNDLRDPESQADLCSYLRKLPDSETLRRRVSSKIQEHGIPHLSDDCLELISQATEFLLKNTIHNYVLTTRTFQTSGNFNFCGISEAEFSEIKDKGVPTMTTNDLYFSLELSPYLLGESSEQLQKVMAQLKQKETRPLDLEG